MEKTEQRASRISQIRSQLKCLDVLNKNSLKVQAKQQKIRQRRCSLQIANEAQAQLLLRKFSQEDQEQYKSNISTFHRQYELIKKIGEGANAVVHSCLYKKTGKIYAVKIIKMDEEQILELKRNFINIRNLRHPRIIRYKALYFDIKKRTSFLVMEYFPYSNLAQIGKVNQQTLKIIFSQILEAVQYLHTNNIIHRDLKPQNILFDQTRQQIKLIDFGISTKTHQRGARRDLMTVIGTPFYVAPEMLQIKGYNEKIDLWSVGITIYFMVARYTPFESEFKGDTVNNIIRGKVQFNKEIWQNYSPLLKDLVYWLLKPAEDRLTASEARSHLFFEPITKTCNRLRKYSEQGCQPNGKFRCQLTKYFHQEQTKNLANAQSKEQGSRASRQYPQKHLKFVQSWPKKYNQNFELYDSQDEGQQTATSRPKIMISLQKQVSPLSRTENSIL